jgi:hypothetical protein
MMPTKNDLGPVELHFDIPSGQRLLGRFFIFVFAACLVMTTTIPILAPHASIVGRIVSVIAITSIGALTVVWLERRMVRSTVNATPSGLCIYNGIRTYVVRWPEVVAFERSSRPFQMAVKRTHGRPISMAAITPGWFGNLKLQFEKMQELEAYWRRMVEKELEPRTPGPTP